MGITKKDIRQRPPVDQYIPYSQNITHEIDGLVYDSKNRKLLSAKEQWDLALKKLRKYVNLFVQIGHVELWKVSQRIKGVINFLGG